jgi:hypothetical protein
MADGETKACARCGREIEWRKKWARNWANVKYCSAACRRAGVSTVDRELESAMLRALRERGGGKTICPSEVAREVGGAGDDGDGRGAGGWRELMEPTRMAARRLTAAGDAEIVQGGKPVDPSSAKGPIRVRLKT